MTEQRPSAEPEAVFDDRLPVGGEVQRRSSRQGAEQLAFDGLFPGPDRDLGSARDPEPCL